MGVSRCSIRAGLVALAMLVMLGGGGRAHATPDAGSAPDAGTTPDAGMAATATASDAATLSARRHFQTGIKLYRDTNYSGALAEFEAAYREKPGPGSLQNVALSLKALFRYAEASQALRLLLERHHAELSEGERTAASEAIAELETLVGTLKVRVEPAIAAVSINGRDVSVTERDAGVKLNVGEHVVVAEAPGYARASQIVRLAGQQTLLTDLTLKATSGFLRVVTGGDEKAAIAIDGEPRGFGSWVGPVAPDVDHLVQVYRDGFEPFERTVRVALGRTASVDGRIGSSSRETSGALPPANPGTPGAPPPPRTATGLYGLLTVGVLTLNNAPLGLDVEDASEATSVSTVGLRAGYRLWESIAVETLVDVGSLKGNNVCQTSASDDSQCYAERDFTLTSLRFGPNLRLFTRGETLRFAVGLGAGAVAHQIELEPTSSSDGSRLSGGKASGFDPYFSFEIGGAFNYRHLLVELSLMAFVEGADHLSGAFDEGDERAVFSDGTLPMLGLGLKLGYSAWSPRR